MTSSDRRARVLCVVGARPNFMKIAPIMRAFRARPQVFDPILLHTGQHYDQAMKDSFFEQLDIPLPETWASGRDRTRSRPPRS
jgi:UDP-N-acetylglucosamine 2-epimerase (non-hydrolysing)